MRGKPLWEVSEETSIVEREYRETRRQVHVEREYRETRRQVHKDKELHRNETIQESRKATMSRLCTANSVEHVGTTEVTSLRGKGEVPWTGKKAGAG
jgi:hypothetical protein